MLKAYFRSYGKRIRPSDKILIFRFASCSLISLFLFFMLLFHAKGLWAIDWNTVSLANMSEIQINLPYTIATAVISLAVCFVIAELFCSHQPDYIRSLLHRQKLARMILENGWYEKESSGSSGFFKDISSSKTKEKISYFPRMHYRMKNGLLHIRVEITMGKYQDQLLTLEKKLESGLFCELVEKELQESYMEYVLLYDTIRDRISINDVCATAGEMNLMKNVSWAYDALPHMLIAGGTGGGKTYFILTLIEALLDTDATLYVLDPKNADLADLAAVMPNVYHKKEDMISCIDAFYDEMMERNESMKQLEGYKTGENYAYFGLPARFLIFDEYVAFMDLLGAKESPAVISTLKQIVMLGRQSGFFLVLACQRPDAKYFADGIRDQFNFRVALGKMSELGYGMMFGETQKNFFQKRIKGRGYVDVGTNVVSEFYTPLVPKEHDFLDEIKQKIAKKGCKKKENSIETPVPTEEDMV